jgi:hypothetical protein
MFYQQYTGQRIGDALAGALLGLDRTGPRLLGCLSRGIGYLACSEVKRLRRRKYASLTLLGNSEAATDGNEVVFLNLCKTG